MQAQIWFVLALAVCQWSIHLTTANDPEELETRVELSAELNDEMGALEELQQAPAIANEPSGEPEILDELPGESTKDLGEDDKSRQGRQTNTDEVNKEAVATSDEPREELKSEKKILGELKEEMGADEKLQQAPGVTIDSRSGPETHKDKHEDSEEPSHGEQMGADDGMQQTLPGGNEPNGPPSPAPDETPDNKTPWVLEREKRLAELKWRMDMDWELQRPLILLNVGEPEPEEAKRAIDKVIELIEKYKKENGGELPVYYDIAFWNYSCIRGDCESAKRGFQMSVNRILHASEPLPWQKITKDSTHIPGYITVFPNLRKYFRHYCLKKYYEDFENKTEAPPAKSWFTKLYSNPLDDKTSGPWNKLTTMNIEKNKNRVLDDERLKNNDE